MQSGLVKTALFVFLLGFSAVQAQGQAPPPPMKKDRTAPAGKEPVPASQTEWTIWKDDHFQISYPPKWHAKTLETPNSLVGFFSVKESFDDFKEIVTVNKTSVVFKGTTAELGEQMEEFMKQQLPEAKLVSSTLIKLNSLEAAQLTFTGPVGENSKSRLIIFSTDHAIYSINILYDLATAKKHEDLFNEMVNTIRIF